VAAFVVLLRGINLGSQRRVAMGDLRDLLEQDLGFTGVRTLLQSGNVVLQADAAAEALRERLESALEARFGFPIEVFVRTAEELEAVVAADPHREVAEDPKRSLVAFLASEPDPAAVEELLARDLGDERVAARGRELYFWCPGGVQSSAAMKAASDPRLGTSATVRNWRTVTRLLALAREG